VIAAFLADKARPYRKSFARQQALADLGASGELTRALADFGVPPGASSAERFAGIAWPQLQHAVMAPDGGPLQLCVPALAIVGFDEGVHPGGDPGGGTWSVVR
jgi:hypothetical protein